MQSKICYREEFNRFKTDPSHVQYLSSLCTGTNAVQKERDTVCASPSFMEANNGLAQKMPNLVLNIEFIIRAEA